MKQTAGTEETATALERYNAMRDFGVTEEPSGERKPTAGGNAFVIQQHAATAMHYDFRLELDGVLLSWAVPKGPSLATTERRLAVQTEDHPVDYRDFEGTIPKGEYGGGAVIVWDKGTWEPIGDPRAGMKHGKLEFLVNGEKIKGKYRLVLLPPRDTDRGNKKNWLLMKGKDAFVKTGADAEVTKRSPESVLSGRTIEDMKKDLPPPRPKAAKKSGKKVATVAKSSTGAAKLPALGSVKPQLALLVDDVPSGKDWVYELKYDGYRAIATVVDQQVSIATRSGKDWTDHFPTVAEALSHVRVENAVFDGEIAYVLEDGRTDFQKLQNALSGAADEGRLVYFVFDLLHYDGVDLTGEPLATRKEKLKTILAGVSPPLKLGDHLEGDGQALFDQACTMGLEGIIAKRIDRPYRPGRGPEWVKIKCQKRQELVIVGYTAPKGTRSGVGALLLAVREGHGYRYAGKVGTGFSAASLQDLGKRLGKLVVDEPSAEGAPKMRDATWVKPALVCEVRFTEWTQDGALRHPTFEGLREDKKPTDVIREIEKALPAPSSSLVDGRAASRPSKRDANARQRGDRGGGAPSNLELGKIKITHPERVVDTTTGITKGELARYAEATVEYFLPYAKKRPLMLVRATDVWPTGGFGGQNTKPKKATWFVQKHGGRGLVSNIGKGEVDGEEIIYVTKADEVFGLVQLNAVELHGWGSRVPKVEQPDWIVFDLDPDVGLPFERVVEAAIDLRDELAKMKLTTFVKTTGGKGLHVVVPLTPKDDWSVVGAFAAAVAVGMVTRKPKHYVATMAKAARTGKIFIDHFRNGRGATAILPYSPRMRPGAHVALPITWDELPTVDPKAFDIRTVPDVLAQRDSDPWEPLLTTKQTLPDDVVRHLLPK